MHEKRNTVTSDIKIQWHPGFYAAAELELSDNQDDLLFQTEHNLSRKPLQIDLLVIKKKKNISSDMLPPPAEASFTERCFA